MLTAFEDGSHRLPDSDLLERASRLGRVVFSSDEDLIVEARRLQREGISFAGVIFAPQECPVGICIEDLELVAKASAPEDLADSLLFLPFP